MFAWVCSRFPRKLFSLALRLGQPAHVQVSSMSVEDPSGERWEMLRMPLETPLDMTSEIITELGGGLEHDLITEVLLKYYWSVITVLDSPIRHDY